MTPKHRRKKMKEISDWAEEMKINPINLELPGNLEQALNWQEYLQGKWDESVLGIPVQYIGERKLTTEENDNNKNN